jgi:hypothetical protein
MMMLGPDTMCFIPQNASSDFLHVALAPEDKEPLERLAAIHGGRSSAVRRAIREEDARTNPLRAFMDSYPGLDLGYLIGSSGSGDTPERGKALAFVYKLLDTHLPDWMERREAAAQATEAGDDAPLILFTMTIREILDSAAKLAEATGTRPWESERDMSGDIMRDRSEHPEHWIPLAEAAEVYRRLGTQNRAERRAMGREARLRGAGKPAGRRRRKSPSDNDSGDGEPSHSSPARQDCAVPAVRH